MKTKEIILRTVTLNNVLQWSVLIYIPVPNSIVSFEAFTSSKQKEINLYLGRNITDISFIDYVVRINNKSISNVQDLLDEVKDFISTSKKQTLIKAEENKENSKIGKNIKKLIK